MVTRVVSLTVSLVRMFVYSSGNFVRRRSLDLPCDIPCTCVVDCRLFEIIIEVSGIDTFLHSFWTDKAWPGNRCTVNFSTFAKKGTRLLNHSVAASKALLSQVHVHVVQS